MMNPAKPLIWVTGVFGKEKSFKRNPILGNEYLNRKGLHRLRVATAAKMAAFRRNLFAGKIDAADRKSFDENGFVIKENFLSDKAFSALKKELFDEPVPVHEMRQGQAVTRMVSLAAAGARQGLSVATDRGLRNLMSYAAGRSGEPMICAQSVIVNSAIAENDPQTDMHADTFHSTAKMWLFMTDVGEEDGPFVYVPGSHKLTPERLQWEHEQSLTARNDERLHHAAGSFRIKAEQLPGLGYGKPQRMAVKANTLIVADTYGFHHRAPSDHPTRRVELYGYLRRNPFVPWNGLDWLGLPGLKGRQLDLFLGYLKFRKKWLGKNSSWRDAGMKAVDAD